MISSSRSHRRYASTPMDRSPMRLLRLAVALCALERVRSATTLTYENPVYAQDHPDPGVLWDPASEVSDRRRYVLGGGGAPW